MEEALQRLLDTELQAEALVKEANAKREQMIRQALEDARTAEQHFEARIPDLRTSFLTKAEERAQQAVAEQVRRYQERHKQLRALAAEHEEAAVKAAVAFLVDQERG